jgi:hypothetical protein
MECRSDEAAISDDLEDFQASGAFAHIRQSMELKCALTASDFAPGFQLEGARISLINPRRGIFKPTQMKHLLSIKTVHNAITFWVLYRCGLGIELSADSKFIVIRHAREHGLF